MITRPFKKNNKKNPQTVEVFSVTDPRLLYFKWHTGWRVTSHTSLWVFILSSGLNLTLCMLWSDEWGIWKFTDWHTNNTSFLMNWLLRWGSSSAKDQWWSSREKISYGVNLLQYFNGSKRRTCFSIVPRAADADAAGLLFWKKKWK